MNRYAKNRKDDLMNKRVLYNNMKDKSYDRRVVFSNRKHNIYDGYYTFLDIDRIEFNKLEWINDVSSTDYVDRYIYDDFNINFHL